MQLNSSANATVIAANAAANATVSAANAEANVTANAAANDAAANANHLQLGITLSGLVAFFDRIDWPYEYRRDESVLGWVTASFGPELTGYDICEHIKAWLRRTGNEDYSVCEVLLREGHVRYVRSVADCFVSHAQSLPLDTFLLTLRYASRRCLRHLRANPYFWVDYVCLRQCRHDFHLSEIQKLIRGVGCTLIELDERSEYLDRSWCIFETYATIEAGAKLLVYDQAVSWDDLGVSGALCAFATRRQLKERLASINVRAEGSRACFQEDKMRIDQLIVSSVGFDALNRRVEEAIGARATETISEMRAINRAAVWLSVSSMLKIMLMFFYCAAVVGVVARLADRWAAVGFLFFCPGCLIVCVLGDLLLVRWTYVSDFFAAMDVEQRIGNLSSALIGQRAAAAGATDTVEELAVELVGSTSEWFNSAMRPDTLDSPFAQGNASFESRQTSLQRKRRLYLVAASAMLAGATPVAISYQGRPLSSPPSPPSPPSVSPAGIANPNIWGPLLTGGTLALGSAWILFTLRRTRARVRQRLLEGMAAGSLVVPFPQTPPAATADSEAD